MLRRMVYRKPLLALLGALNAGLLGYYLFTYDDGMAPKWVTPGHTRARKPGPAGSAQIGAKPLGTAAGPAAPEATAAEPGAPEVPGTAPPE